MIIRKAELYDIQSVHEMVQDFQEEDLAQYGLGHTIDSTTAAIEMFIRHHLGVVAVEDDKVIGCLGGFVTPFYLDKNSIVFQEILWYVRPENRSSGAGLKLLQKVMEVAKKAGCTHIVMGHPGSVAENITSKVYSHFGFKVLETHHIRGL
jgi:N-acetylglutamate synthase-like GNAT family acetyltransferase